MFCTEVVGNLGTIILGKERVREIIASVTPSLIDYTTDAAEFDRVRRMLGDELEAAIG